MVKVEGAQEGKEGKEGKEGMRMPYKTQQHTSVCLMNTNKYFDSVKYLPSPKRQHIADLSSISHGLC